MLNYFFFFFIDMYYDKNQVDEVLICEYCNQIIDQPKILPCFETICSFCEQSIEIINGNKFECFICKEIHEMPKNGLPFNKKLLKMLSIKPTKVSRGKAFDANQETLNEIETKHCRIKRGIESSNDLIIEYCMDLKSNVQLKVNEIILQVNDLGAIKIEQINDYEQELIELNKTINKPFDEFEQDAKKIKLFHSENTEYLKQHVVDDEKVIKSNEEAISWTKKADSTFAELKNLIFSGKFLKFEKNEQILNESILGSIIIEDVRIKSNILSSSDQINDLISLCEFPVHQKWTLIYRASRDGFEASSFHSKCDDVPNTLVTIKTSDTLFGGFTEQSWSSNNVYKSDSNAFIFSLINRLNKPVKMKWTQNKGIGCFKEYGPIFGGGLKGYPSDICIFDNSNKNLTSLTNLGHSYAHSNYAFESNEAKSFLAGTYKFKVLDIEIFTASKIVKLE
jgi:hypothetical protein